jgi:hypothetical protein
MPLPAHVAQAPGSTAPVEAVEAACFVIGVDGIAADLLVGAEGIVLAEHALRTVVATTATANTSTNRLRV